MEFRKDGIEESYVDVEKLLYQTAHLFQKRYGGEFDELVGIANLAFTEAYRSYNGASKFATWTRFVAWRLMLDHVDNEIKSKRTRPQDFEITEHKSPLIDVLDELEEDAKTVVELVLHTPEDLQLLIQDSGGGIKKIKSVLTMYLSKLGWKQKRIKQSFLQIQEAL